MIGRIDLQYRKLQTFSSDPSGIIQAKLRSFLLTLKKTFSSIAARFLCMLKGIELGEGCLFFGIPLFVRHVNSEIIIGNAVRFRSDFSSNLVGVNRRCIVATHREGAVIKIGDNTGLSGAVIGASKSIVIGRNVFVGANCLITDFDWHNIDPKLRQRPVQSPSSPVIIEDNVWLGINVIVLKGVTIGENSVIGANSVVTKSVPANVIAAGNPCKVIKEL